MILHIHLYMGNKIWYFHTSNLSHHLWIYVLILFLITDMSWLNSYLKYSVMYIFELRYMCMSKVRNFV